MAQYRLVEITDIFINDGEPYYEVQKRIWPFGWTTYFEEHRMDSATFYNKDNAIKWYNYHCDKSSRINKKVLASCNTKQKQ